MGDSITERMAPRTAAAAAVLWAALLGAPAEAGSGKFIVDPVSGCGTNNPFLVPGETIRWYGQCRDGALDGPGTLIWYQGQTETERNVGTFRKGDFHGNVVTNFPDGQIVYGQYVNGLRHGDFMIVRIDGAKIAAVYENGKLKSQKSLSDSEAASWSQRPVASLQAYSPPTPPAPASRPAAVRAPGPAAVRASGPAPARRAEEAERPGFFSRTLSVLNPANWGILDAIGGLFGGGEEEAAPRSSAVAPAAPVAPVAPVVVESPRPAARPVARPADRVQARPTISPPAQVARVRPAPVRGAPAPRAPAIEEQVSMASVHGKIYDMRALLHQPHPFARTPVAKSEIPVWGRDTGAPVSYVAASAGGGFPEPRPWVGADRGEVRSEIADSLFAMGYQAERTGDRVRAAKVYEQLIEQYPSVPSARLANDRLRTLQTGVANEAYKVATAAQDVPAAPPETAPPGHGAGARVIAMNAPHPAPYRARSDRASAGRGFYDSPLINHEVCSRDGLYDGHAKWCGIVRRDDGTHLLVEVRDVQVSGFGTIGITRSTCTGGVMLTWFSRNSTVRVPRQCLEDSR